MWWNPPSGGSRQPLIARMFLILAAAALPVTLHAAPISPAAHARLAAGKNLYVIVEFNAAAAEAAANAERRRRGLSFDDRGILASRESGYAAIKSRVELQVPGADAARVLDYSHFPLAVWRLSSLAALNRLESNPLVRMVHENTLLYPVSVSDLGFINQPQAAAQGAKGAGTTIAVIDGGLGNNYLTYSDFGTCTGVNTPASTCRVVFNQDFYPGASTETVHGTNVSAIALGVAPGAKLAMYDVFNGSSASSADVLNAMNAAISDQATYNIVAINLSLGDGSSNSTQCTNSVYASAVSSASNAGITTVASAGNSGSKTGIGNPACTPGVVSVGAVYDAGYGTVTWRASAATNGQCTDASAADRVTCFSQSANYLSMLAPGTFVNAPNSTFQGSGTSQAAPHISGAVAVLRASYPAETLSQILQRMQLSDIKDTDPANGLTTPRLNLLAAFKQGTALALSGTGPTQAVSGGSGTYSITVTNNGPLTATNVVVTDTLPAGATFVSASSGCTLVSSSTVRCVLGSLANGAHPAITINVKWTVSGAVYDSASVSSDQINSAPPAQQTLAFGVPPTYSSDGPVPPWAYVLLALTMGLIARRRLVPAGARMPG
jgi:uncharacterized repeat protein (TIGR01451 family)